MIFRARLILKKIITPFLLLLFIASCTDNGCIEADDFGEYATQTLTVYSNINAGNCTYDSTLALNDPSQGTGLKTCFTSGSPDITDENNNPPNPQSTTGCLGLFGQPTFQKLCTDYCISACNQGGSSGGVAAEPIWQATTSDGTMKITPLSQVFINVNGNVVLGNNLNLPSTYVRDDTYLFQSSDSNWHNVIVDVQNGQTRNLTFSGKWNDGSGALFGNSANAVDVTNGTRSLAAYVIPAPAGYGFDYTKNNEKDGTIGVPLFADPSAWGCTYSGSGNSSLLQSNCASSSYVNIGYTNASDSAANVVYGITSSQEASNLGAIGGMVRWDGDGLNDTTYNQFSANTVDCSSGSCTNVSNVASSFGKIIGDLSSGNITIANNNNFAVSASFKPLISSVANPAACNFNLNVTVVDSGNNTLSSYSVPLNNAKWSDINPSAIKIALEAGNSLVITQNATSYTSTGNIAKNCGTAIALRFLPYQDILVATSGLINFKILGGPDTASGNCTILGRVVNPSGSHVISNGINPDFYEYGDFNTATDPLNNLNVTASTNSSGSWSNQIFVRKGQIIRFAPESWLGTWNTGNVNSVSRQCGIGMAMYITPRPALLCRGYAHDAIPNPNCTQDYSTGSLTGCMATSSSCTTNGDPAYCPLSTCQPTITCDSGTAANFYAKTNCVASTNLSNSDFVAPGQCSGGMSMSSCANCGTAEITNAQLPAIISQPNLIQCYDLENYTGSIANIPSSTGFAIDNDGTLNDPNSKGAIKMLGFNGSYGNFANYTKSQNPADAFGNTTYALSSPMIFSQTGRLRFLILSGNDFLNMTTSNYSGNTPAGGAYNGNNGYQISANGQLNFSNGGWLEAILCQESSDTSNNCSQVTRPTSLAGVPKVVELNNPTVSTILNPTTKTSFNFDQFGDLTRISNPSDNPEPDNNLVPVGSNFYVHDYLNLTATDLANLNNTQSGQISRLRLSFKIKDPETPTCSSNGNSIIDGVSMVNPAYVSQNNCVITGTANNGITSNSGVCVASSGSGLNCAVLNGVLKPDGTCVSNSGNAGQTCGIHESPTTTPEPPAGDTQCMKQYYCGNTYSNNTGQYYVTVRIKDPNNTISNIVSSVITPVITIMDGSEDGTKIGQSQLIYNLIINDGRYQAILSMCLVIMFTFYGLGYLMGVSELTNSEIMIRVIKIGVIYLFVGPQGWYWFNTIIVKMFKNGTDYVAFLMATSFDNSPKIANAIASGNYYDKSILFSSVDDVFGMFFSRAVQAKVSALLFASVFGFIYLYIIYLSFFLYVYAVANAVLLYLTAQVFISILFILGPIFFIFPLFNQTKNMFDNWLKALIGFSLQQIFLLTTLAFFNMMMYEVIKMSLGYKVCWDDVWVINIITRIKLLSYWTIASLPPSINSQSQIGDIGNVTGVPSLFSILYIWIIASLMNKFVEFMTDLASSIGGGIKASSLAGGLKEAASDLKKEAMNSKYLPFKHINDAVRNKVAQMDDKYFNSGAIADNRRNQQKAQDKVDKANKSSLRKAANKAESKYKKENAVDYAKLKTKEDKQAKISAVRDGAMEKRAGELGLSKHDLARLKNDTEFKYRGTNVFGAGAALIKQVVSGDGLKLDLANGRIMKAMGDNKIKTEFTRGEIKAAMKNVDDEGRDILVESAKKGDIKIAKSRAEKVGSVIKTTVKATFATPVVAAVGSAYLAKGALSRIAGEKKGFKQAKTDFLNNKIINNSIVKPLATKATEGVEGIGNGLEVAARTTAGTVVGSVAGVGAGVTMAATTVATTTVNALGGAAAIAALPFAATGAVVGTLGGLGKGVYNVATGKGFKKGFGEGFGAGFKYTASPFVVTGAVAGTLGGLGKGTYSAATGKGFSKGFGEGFGTGFKYGGGKLDNSVSILKYTAKASTIASKPAAKIFDSKAFQGAVEFSKDQFKKSHDIIDSPNTDYNKATNQLQDQGKISRFVPGTAALGRSAQEKQMIKDLVKKNKLEQEITKPDQNSVSNIAYMQKIAAIEKAKSSPQASDDLGIRAKDTLFSKLFGRQRSIALSKTKDDKYFAQEAKKDLKQVRRETFEKSIKSQRDEARIAQTKIGSELDQYREGLAKIRQHPKMQEMQEIEKQIATATTPEEKRAHQYAADDLKKNSEYKAQADLERQASIEIFGLETQEQNTTQKLAKLDKIHEVIEDVNKIKTEITDEDGSLTTNPEIKKAQDNYGDLDASFEAYEEYSNKYKSSEFNSRRVSGHDSDSDDNL